MWYGYAAIKTKNSLLGRIENLTYPFVLPELPYAYNALEPYIDEPTMRIHYTKHHQAYVDNLNAAIKNYPELYTRTLYDFITQYDTLPAAIATTVRNNAGGHYNHSLFWLMMQPYANREPHEPLLKAITKTFGSFTQFQSLFNAAAKTVFGSGWAWLCVDTHKNLVIVATPNQDSPQKEGLTPILGLDVWEHAYYLKYQNQRPNYITAWWDVVNWAFVQDLYEKAITKS
jgi:Fe-Mn family superoxide dismutase